MNDRKCPRGKTCLCRCREEKNGQVTGCAVGRHCEKHGRGCHMGEESPASTAAKSRASSRSWDKRRRPLIERCPDAGTCSCKCVRNKHISCKDKKLDDPGHCRDHRKGCHLNCKPPERKR